MISTQGKATVCHVSPPPLFALPSKSSVPFDTCMLIEPKTGREREREKEGGGEGGLCKGKVFVESMPGALASGVCKCGCEVFPSVCI